MRRTELKRKSWLKRSTTPLPRGKPPKRSTKAIPKIGKGAKGRQARYQKHLRSAAFRAVRLERFKLDDYRCYLCGQQYEIQDLTFDHSNYRHVGRETVEDGKTACKWCHRVKDGAKLSRAMHVKRS